MYAFARYDRVYDGKMDCISLENIYQKFNIDHPADYKGRSLSVSDVVEIRESDTLNPGFYFVDSIGFKSISFDKSLCKEPVEAGSGKISVLLVEPNKYPKMIEIDDTLEAMQAVVGGDIEEYKSLSILEPVEYTKNDGSTGIAYNVKKVFDVAQTSGKKPAAPTLDRDPRKLVAIMLDTAPIDVSTVEELPSPNMGAFYKNEDQTLYIKRDIGNSVALCQCVAQELGHAQLAMNCEAYSRRDMGFSAVCVGYMLCRKFGVDVQNFAIDRIPEELAGKSPKEIRAELSKTRSAMSEIGSRVSEEIYRRRADRNKEQKR